MVGCLLVLTWQVALDIYRQIRELGVIFIRYRLDDKPVVERVLTREEAAPFIDVDAATFDTPGFVGAIRGIEVATGKGEMAGHESGSSRPPPQEYLPAVVGASHDDAQRAVPRLWRLGGCDPLQQLAHGSSGCERW